MTSPDVTDEPVGGAEETIPEDRLPAYFWRDEQGRFVPNEVAAGLWAPNTISGRMVGGLFGHALVEEHGVPGYRLSRLNVDLFRSIPYAPLTVKTELVRAGGRIRVADARMEHDGKLISRATAVFLRPSQEPPGELWHGERVDVRAPDPNVPHPDMPPNPRVLGWPMLDDAQPLVSTGGTEKVARGGRWVRDRHAMVAGTPLTPLIRALMVGDMTSPTVHRGTAGIHFINTDFTLVLTREPVGEVFGLLTLDQHSNDGISCGLAHLYDSAGLLGTCMTTALANAGPLGEFVNDSSFNRRGPGDNGAGQPERGD